MFVFDHEFKSCVYSYATRLFYINFVWGGCNGDKDFTLVCVDGDSCHYCQFNSFPKFLYSVYKGPTKFVDYNGRFLKCCLNLPDMWALPFISLIQQSL